MELAGRSRWVRPGDQAQQQLRDTTEETLPRDTCAAANLATVLLRAGGGSKANSNRLIGIRRGDEPLREIW